MYHSGVRRNVTTSLLLFGLSLPFIGKPVHIDDTNFLTLAEGAAADPWRPHDVQINWQGSTERAYDVLSNPPGIAWWLSPVVDSPVWVMHLWMMPWLLLAIWGSWSLGQRFAGRAEAAVLLICGAPISMLATQSFTPDLPLLACTVAGFGGLVREGSTSTEKRWVWALIVGMTVLFRYSGLVLIPLVFAWGWRTGGRRAALVLGSAAAVPGVALAVHDLMAYGQAHVLAMLDFQSTSTGGRDLARKTIAMVAMLGGAALLPVLCWTRPRGAGMGAAIGLGLGLAGAQMSAQSDISFFSTLIFSTAGGASLGGALLHRWVDRDTRWLASWALLGLIFLLALRFTASRYWIPFFPALVLLTLRMGPSIRLTQFSCVLTLLLSLGLSTDDYELALVQRDLAQRVLEIDEEGGRVAGHWGWQHHLRDSQWQILEEDSPVPQGRLLVVSGVSWPQSPAEGCFELIQCISATPLPGLPRVHAPTSGANFHSFLSSALPGSPDQPCDLERGWDIEPIETYAPWTFSHEPQDVLTIWRSCGNRKPQ
jgi:hypothetical protein